MQRSAIRLLVVLFLVAAVTVLFGSASFAQEEMQKEGDEGQMMHDKDMMHGDMDYFWTADTLYQCPNHPWFITTDKDAHCAVKECETALVMMTPEQVKALRDAHPKGHEGCHFIVAGDNEATTCAVCGGPIEELKKPEMKEEMQGDMMKKDEMKKKDEMEKKKKSEM